MKKLTLSVVAFALSAVATIAIAQSETDLATPAASDPVVREGMMSALKRAAPAASLQNRNASQSGSPTGPSIDAVAAMPTVKSMAPAK